MQKKEINHLTSDNTIAEEAKASFKNETLGKSVASGKRDAEGGHPRVKGDKLLNYLAPLFTQVQGFIDKLRSIHLADETITLSKNRLEEEKKALINEREVKEKALGESKSKYWQMKEGFPSTLAYIMLALILVFSISDGLLSRLGIAALIGKSASLFVALVLGISFAFLAHKYFTLWIKEGSKIQKLVRKLGLVLFFSAIFFFLGMLRSYEINSSNAGIEESSKGFFHHVDYFQSFIHCFVSWVFFLPSVILSRFLPTWEQIQNLFKATELKKEIKTLEKELDAILSEIHKLQVDIDDLEQYEYSRNKSANRYETEVLNLVPSIVSHYIQSNNRHRRGEQPDCFNKVSKVSYPFTTYFQNQTEEETPKTKTERIKISLLPKMIILFLGICLSSCSKKEKVPVLDLVICKDITEGENMQISYQDIRDGVLEIDKYLWYEYNIKVKELTELNQGLSYSTHLPPGDSEEELLSSRKQTVHHFLTQTKEMMAPHTKEQKGKQYSFLYKPIATEINTLVRNSRATNKRIIINSDLIENNPSMSIYDKRTHELLYSNPDAIIQQFQKMYPLEEDLSGITVLIVYHATVKDNALHTKMAELYQYMLNRRGAYVCISANYDNPKPLLP